MWIEATQTLQERRRGLWCDNVLRRRIVDVIQDYIMADSSARPTEAMQDVYWHCRKLLARRTKARSEVSRQSRRNEDDELCVHRVQKQLVLYPSSCNSQASVSHLAPRSRD